MMLLDTVNGNTQPDDSLSYGDKWRRYFLYIIVVTIFLAGAVGLAYAFLGADVQVFNNAYVLPPILLLLLVLSLPTLNLLAKREFYLFHPLVFPVWSYFFPAFILGSLYFATGGYEPSYLKLIGDPERIIPLALFYVALGFASLSFGFSLYAAKKTGRAIAYRLPKWDWDVEKMIVPFLLLIVVGRIFELGAFVSGAVGYQLLESSTSIGVTYYYFSVLGYLAYFLLWLTVFQSERMQIRHFFLILFLLLLIPYSMMIAGSKGELLRNMITIMFAFWASGRVIRLRHGIIAIFLFSLAIVVGFTYGTMFRIVKGSEANVSLVENIELWDRTINAVRGIDLTENLGLAVEKSFQRFETITSLSVIVANYEQLHPFEEDYGISNNIWTYSWTAFIPRLLWPEKPVVSDARSVAALYFEVEDTSFAITPMGDLLRNFGPIGIMLGMGILGFVLRIMYSSLIEGQAPSAWRSVTYYLLLTTVSYEGFFGTIFPALLRVGFILLIGLLMVNTIRKCRVT